MKNILFAAIILAFALGGCKDEDDKKDDPTPKTLRDSVTFTAMVLPIFNKSCNLPGCHNGSGSGGVDLRTNQSSKTAATTKKLLPSIKHESGVSQMPQGSAKLPQREIDIIQFWVEKGYPE